MSKTPFGGFTPGRVYKARPGVRYSQEHAQNIGEGLAEIGEQQGKLTPSLVLDAVGKHDGHRLHRYFEWNDQKAARGYRMNQARQLIRATEIEVTIETPEGKVTRDIPTYIGVRVSSTGRKLKQVEYHTVETVIHNNNYRDDVVDRAKKDAKDWLQRYLRYRDILGGDFDNVFKVLAQIA